MKVMLMFVSCRHVDAAQLAFEAAGGEVQQLTPQEQQQQQLLLQQQQQQHRQQAAAASEWPVSFSEHSNVSFIHFVSTVELAACCAIYMVSLDVWRHDGYCPAYVFTSLYAVNSKCIHCHLIARLYS
jgi:uncharacterized protein with NAD-binding domain and iron-sulfur cluster